MNDDTQNMNYPLHLRILAGIGAWFTALLVLIFVLLFVGLSEIFAFDTGLVVIGLLSLGLAAIQQRKGTSGPYADQLSLALALAGSGALVFGIAWGYGAHEPLLTAFWAQTVVALVGYPLIRDAVYRFLIPLSAVLLAACWLVFSRNHGELFHPLVAACTLLLGWLWLHRHDNATLRPLAYAAALMVPACLLFLNFTQSWRYIDYFNEPMWPSSLILSALLITLFYHFSAHRDVIKQPWFLVAAVATLLLGLFTTPGVLAAASLLVLGHHYRDRILITLAHLFMVAFLVWYYYALNVDLAYKSWVIAGSGAVLLAARRIVIVLEQRRTAQ